jgi:hypothetical protein
MFKPLPPPPQLRTGSNELFGGEVPTPIRKLIDNAKASPPDLASEQLWAIQMCAPECLPVYYLLYKLHATRREFARAERAALLGLAEAGHQSGLPGEVERALKCEPTQVDFMLNGPARFWLFTLKALAFIRMRSGRLEQARQLIECIKRLDPQQSLGSDVVNSLLSAAKG